MAAEEDIKTSLPKEIFDVPMNSDLLHQVVVSQMANRRVAISHTKDRSEVRGGGAKPWRQKGTGRARHGSRRSPIWIGGGVTHGPTNERNFKKRLPKNIKKKALFIALSEKLRNDLIIIVDSFDINEIKTKKVIEMLNNLGIKESCLIVLPKIDSNMILSTRNIPKVNTIQAKDINCLDILSSKYLLIDKEGLKVIEETFKK
ncbi:MAG: 50S ribosomal protein L4 [Parcubacteria group bacterium]|jgi:large subunit ribosomal protein L4|nr:MAG: ribosomal protein L4 RplD [Parcubacteria bacterium 34_609]KUK98795.1 MAG: ribosomal protein L4 RplD [Parcubacteria bacterium 32_520]NMB39860.1 50S ribosomal protein L4 [Parcubacteria group bacterium]